MKLYAGIFLASGLCLAQGCSTFQGKDKSAFDSAVDMYKQLTAEKAMAVSFESKGWVYGYSYDFPTQALADERALSECEARRLDKKLNTPCRIYMRGNVKAGQ